MSFWRFKQTSMTNRQSGNSGNDPDPEAERLRRSISEWPSERDVIQRFQQQQQQQQQQGQGRGQSGQNQSTSDPTKRNSPPNKNQKTYPGFQVFKETTNPKEDELLEETRAEQELRKRQKEDEWYEMAREMDKLLHPKKAMKEPRLPEPKKFKSSGSHEHKDYERKRH